MSELDRFGPLDVNADLPSVFVEKSMVPGAEQDEVVEIGRPTVGPVLAVVRVQPAGAVAAGSPAVPVAVIEQAVEARSCSHREC